MISEENPPVISIHGIDIIYYGKNLEDYFNIEFNKKYYETVLTKSREFACRNKADSSNRCERTRSIREYF